VAATGCDWFSRIETALLRGRSRYTRTAACSAWRMPQALDRGCRDRIV